MNSQLNQLASQYGTPLFVLDEVKLEQEVTQFVSAFQQHIHQVEVCYSVKTNYTPWVVQKINALGVKPEIIAGFELDLVEQLAITGPLYVNGPVKQSNELKQCVTAGHIINIDNIDELERLIDIVKEYKKHTIVGIRLRPEGESWKRFGIKYQSDVWFRSLELIEACEYLDLQGLHMHIGTGIIDIAKYRAAAVYIKKIANSLPYPLKYIDLGGGFATATARLNNYNEQQWQVPTPEAYAKVIGEVINEYLNEHNCKLVLEPGRALIDESVDLLTRVVSVDDERIIVDAGKNIIPSVESRIHPVEAINGETSEPQKFDIFGPLCMGSDCLSRDLMLTKPKVDDILVVRAVGAYSQSQAMQFIKYSPAMVVVDRASNCQLIQRRQTIQDLMVLDKL